MFSSIVVDFDLPSFLLGIALAVMAWFLAKMLRFLISSIRKQVQVHRERDKNHRTRATGNALMAQMLRIVQSNHLLGKYYPLDDLLIEPRFLAFPRYFFPSPLKTRSISTYDHLPFLPFCPEYAIQNHLPGLSLVDAIVSNDRIVVIGDSGTGKTVSLCSAVTQLLRKDSAKTKVIDLTPIYIDYFDIFEIISEDPHINLGKLTHSVYARNDKSLSEGSVQNFIDQTLKDEKLVLFIDGLDELPSGSLHQAEQWLKFNLEQHPTLKIVITLSPYYFGDILRLGFSPIYISPWNQIDQDNFIHKICSLLNSLPKSKPDHSAIRPSVYEQLITMWVLENASHARAIEFVSQVLAAHTMTANHVSNLMPIASLVDCLAEPGIPIAKLSTSTTDLIKRQIIYFRLDSNLSNQGNTQPDNNFASIAEYSARLLSAGLLRKSASGWIKFINPYFLGAIASLANVPAGNDLNHSEDWLRWSVAQDYARLAIHKEHLHPFVVDALNDSSPQQWEFIRAIRWFDNISNNDKTKSMILRRLVQQVQNKSLPLPTRAWLIMTGLANNADAPAVLKNLLSSEDPDLRLHALLAISASDDKQYIPTLQAHVSYEHGVNHIAGWLALYLLSPENIKPFCQRNIQQGEEDLRIVTAEILAMLDAPRHTLLLENAKSSDILTKVSALHGLGYVDSDEAKALLAKIAVEDDQWIVRKSAEVGQESSGAHVYLAPFRTPEITTDEWLIQYGSRMGLGVHPDQPPIDILSDALRSDIQDDFLQAIQRIPRFSGAIFNEQLKEKLLISNAIDQNVILYNLCLNDRSAR